MSKITTCYVLKKERLFTDSPDLLSLQTKNGISKLGASYSDASAYFAGYKVMHEDLKKLISKVNYFSILSDGITDSAVTEQEMIYVLYICVAIPILKNADVPGITHYYNILVGLNLDGASSNMGKHNGLNVLVRDKAPWV